MRLDHAVKLRWQTSTTVPIILLLSIKYSLCDLICNVCASLRDYVTAIDRICRQVLAMRQLIKAVHVKNTFLGLYLFRVLRLEGLNQMFSVFIISTLT